MTIITILRQLFGTPKCQYDIEPKIVEIDNELSTRKPEVKAYFDGQFKKVEPSAPYTVIQLEVAERSGGGVKE